MLYKQLKLWYTGPKGVNSSVHVSHYVPVAVSQPYHYGRRDHNHTIKAGVSATPFPSNHGSPDLTARTFTFVLALTCRVSTRVHAWPSHKIDLYSATIANRP